MKCRAWLRSDTFMGVKVLRYVYVPGLNTFWTYLVSDQEFLKKNEIKRKKVPKYFWQKNEGIILNDRIFNVKK